MMREVEELMWWARDSKKLEYIHMIVSKTAPKEDEGIEWEGKIRAIKTNIYKVS